MNVFLGLIFILVLGYAGSHLTEYTQRFSLALQSLLTLGAGFLLLGILTGPQASGILSPDALEELSPVISLGIGWIGLLVGMQFDWQLIRQIPGTTWLIGIFISLITILLLFIGLYALGQWQSYYPVFPAGFCLCLACTASVSNYSAMALIKNIDSARGGIIKQIQLLTDIRAPLAIIIMTLWYCFDAAVLDNAMIRATQNTGSLQLQNTVFFPFLNSNLLTHGFVWVTVSILLGVSLGWLLHYLTSERLQPNEMLLVLTGAVLLSSGLAATVHLSPLFINFVMGATLTNLPNFARGRVSNRLMQTERPFFIVFMIFTGAIWTPISWFVLSLVLFYCVVRIISLYISVQTAQLLFIRNVQEKKYPLHWSMISQGGMALAVVVDYYIIQTSKYAGLPIEENLQDFFAGTALNIVIVSMLINQFAGANTLRYLLRVSGTIKPDKQNGARRNLPSPEGTR